MKRQRQEEKLSQRKRKQWKNDKDDERLLPPWDLNYNSNNERRKSQYLSKYIRPNIIPAYGRSNSNQSTN